MSGVKSEKCEKITGKRSRGCKGKRQAPDRFSEKRSKTCPPDRFTLEMLIFAAVNDIYSLKFKRYEKEIKHEKCENG